MWWTVVANVIGLGSGIDAQKDAQAQYLAQQTAQQQSIVGSLGERKSDIAVAVFLLIIVGLAIFFAVKSN